MRGAVAMAGLAALLLAAPAGVGAPLPQPDRVRGVLESDGRRLELRQGVALLHDDAEGLDGGVERLRLLLSDAPVDPAALEGESPELALQGRARSGALRGVLLSLDPAAPEQVVITPLLPPAPGATPTVFSLTLFRSGGPGPGAFESFAVSGQRLRASLQHRRETPDGAVAEGLRSLSLQVDLPLRREAAVTARVQGGEAVRATPQGRLALDRARAMAALDAAGLARLRAQAPADGPPLPDAELLPLLRELAAEQLQGLQSPDLLLVERGDRAVLVIRQGEGSRSWITFHRLNGVWAIGGERTP